jgi:hypothetical protein
MSSGRLQIGSWLSSGRQIVLAMYVLAAMLLPLAHHDVACHLKTPTHCVTCVVGASGDVAAQTAVLARSWLADLGSAVTDRSARFDSAPLSLSSGRAPPRSL